MKSWIVGGKRVPLLERPGVIGVVSGDRTTYPQFAADVATVQSTPGSRLIWRVASGGALAAARNEICNLALDHDAGWVWFIDDDHVFEPTILRSLLHADRDVCVPLVMTRLPPHAILAWSADPPVPPTATDAELKQLGLSVPSLAHGFPPNTCGPIEIGMGATCGMLFSREVLNALPSPWFEWGRFEQDTSGMDTWFCLKARRAGFKVFCDPTTQMGHLTPCAVWPVYDPAYGAVSGAYRLRDDVHFFRRRKQEPAEAAEATPGNRRINAAAALLAACEE
jgi:hypothetical protein